MEKPGSDKSSTFSEKEEVSYVHPVTIWKKKVDNWNEMDYDIESYIQEMEEKEYFDELVAEQDAQFDFCVCQTCNQSPCVWLQFEPMVWQYVRDLELFHTIFRSEEESHRTSMYVLTVVSTNIATYVRVFNLIVILYVGYAMLCYEYVRRSYVHFTNRVLYYI